MINRFGLPDGVTKTFEGDKLTFAGTPTTPGTYPYTITTTGCAPFSVTGTITVETQTLNLKVKLFLRLQKLTFNFQSL